MIRQQLAVLLLVSMFPIFQAVAEDWPTWRYDAARSGEWRGELGDDLKLQWVRHHPPLTPAYRNPRLQFDGSYEPVVKDGILFFGSSANGRVTALDVVTGAERWRYYTEGPIRFAPVAWQDRVFVGSDDGHLYCLRADDGALVWKFRAVPANRLVLGNGRLISVWPVRGGPVIVDDVIYFAAGVWSFEGTFVYALNAKSGEVVWVNDRTSFLYGQHPHDAKAFGGLTPQGYLVVDDDELIVPCGTALPARFDRATGELKHFALPKPGRVPGGWFATVSAAKRRGLPIPEEERIQFDSQVNRDRHEGGWREGPGDTGVKSRVTLNGKEFAFDQGYPGTDGTVHGILAADDRLFVVTKEGGIYCFGLDKTEPRIYPAEEPFEFETRDPHVEDQSVLAEKILAATGVRHGYGLICAPRDVSLIEQIARQSNLQLIVLEADEEKVGTFCRYLDGIGLLGERVAVFAGRPSEFELPSYFAHLVVIDDLAGAGFPREGGSKLLGQLFEALRPYGGTAHVRVPDGWREVVSNAIEEASLESAEWRFSEGRFLLSRQGALPGATNYTGGWESPDERVRAPLALLWFGDALSHFKRAPQPMIVDGVMISYDKDWLGWVDGVRPPYALLPPTYSDIYTGRIFSSAEVEQFAATLPTRDIREKQAEQYRPPSQTNAWSPEPPKIGMRTNPLTGNAEPRAIPKSYGCDGGIDYGMFYTLRSGTAAFYDKLAESGTIHISGPRSGCTNSVIPAGGILNVPYFFDGCSCSYPLPAGLAMVSVPPEREQWAVWGEGQPEAIQRIGVNFGAPGVRMSPAGTLWLDYPLAGGPAPTVALSTVPESVDYFYRHSIWMRGGVGWPWVAASGMRGMTTCTLEGLKSGSFTLRLHFVEPDHEQAGQRVFDVLLDDRPLIEALDIAAETGGVMRALVKEIPEVRIDGTLRLNFVARKGVSIISGFELIQEGLGLSLDELPKIPERTIQQLDSPWASVESNPGNSQ